MKLKFSKQSAFYMLAALFGLSATAATTRTTASSSMTIPPPGAPPAGSPATNGGTTLPRGARYVAYTSDGAITGGISRDTDTAPATGGLPPFLASHPAANQPVYTGKSPIISQSQLKTLSRDQMREFDLWKATTTGLKAGSNVAPTDPNATPPDWWIPTYL